MIFRALKWLITPQRRRLSEISDEARAGYGRRKTELGMEATDLDHVDKVNRRNQALERASAYGRSGWFGISSADISALRKFKDNDADYARKYHHIFKKGTPRK